MGDANSLGNIAGEAGNPGHGSLVKLGAGQEAVPGRNDKREKDMTNKLHWKKGEEHQKEVEAS